MDACAQPRLALLYCPPPAMVSLLQADGVRPRGYEIVVAGPGGGAPKAVGARLRCPWRVFALDAKADVEAHIKDVALVVNCAGAGEDPTVLVQACVRLAIPYLDTEVIDCERVFDATLSAGQPPTAPVVSGLGAATAVLDCLGHLLRSRLSDGDLQHHNLKLFLAQSELAPEQAAKRVRRTFVPFIIRNGNKLVAGTPSWHALLPPLVQLSASPQPGGILWDAPLRRDDVCESLLCNPYCGAAFLSLLDTGIPSVEAFVARPVSVLRALVQTRGPVVFFARVAQLAARATLRVPMEALTALLVRKAMLRLLTEPPRVSDPVGFVTPAQLFGAQFAFEDSAIALEYVRLTPAGDSAPFPWLLLLFASLVVWFMLKFIR